MSEVYTPEMKRRCPHCHNLVIFTGFELGDAGVADRFNASVETFGMHGFREHLFVPMGLELSLSKTVIVLRISDKEGFIYLTPIYCGLCDGLILLLRYNFYEKVPGQKDIEYIAWPRYAVRYVPEQVPEHIRSDYQESAAVLEISPKSSAALSRRCLQAVLREAGGAIQHNLIDQIKAVKPNLPSYISENIDAIRNIGNFAAHPIKASANGQIIEVEPGEAEWNLDMLDLLFDFYYVQPQLADKKRDSLNKKLKDAGKPPMG